MIQGDTQRMQCMEVWGGNQPVDSGVVMAGLDAWVYSKPYEGAAAGGDVHYVSSCATGRVTRLLVADVSGHGQAVAATAVDLRSLMRQYVNYLDQTRFVESMNDRFVELSKMGCFATAVVTTFFAPTHDLTLCNAGHPPPLLYRARNKTWSVLEQDHPREKGAANMPLGVVDLTRYEQFGVRLRVGDLVLCYTDSLIEAKDGNGEWIGTEGLLRVVRSLDPSEPSRFIPALLAAIQAIAPGNLGDDDVTALLFRPNGHGARVPFRDRLLAPFRVLGGIFGALRPGAAPAPWPDFSLPNIGGAMFHSLNRFWRNRDVKDDAD